MARQVYGANRGQDWPASKLVVEAWDSDPDGVRFLGRQLYDQ